MTKQIDILIGVAGSGKSTYAKNMSYDKVFSSDAYRMDYFGDLQHQEKDHQTKIWDFLNRDLFSYIETVPSFHICLDATNLSRKRRTHLYKLLKTNDVVVTSVVFMTPLYQLHLTNEYRQSHDESKAVPEHIIQRMYETLEVPFIGVDTDNIAVPDNLNSNWFNTIDFEEVETIADIINAVKDDHMAKQLRNGIYQPHHSIYHQESIDTHIGMVANQTITTYQDCDNLNDMMLVAWFHDLGKAETTKVKSIEPERIHSYQNHENVSAMYAMNYCWYHMSESEYRNKGEYVVKMIAYHMLPFRNPKQKTLNRKCISNNLWQDILDFNEIDAKCSINEK